MLNENSENNNQENKVITTSGKKSKKQRSSSQKKLNRSNISDTIKILNLLKSYPTTTSTSFQTETKLNANNIENNSLNNINMNAIDNLSYEEIKAICLNIFLLYAKPINGQFYLKLRSIFKVLKELEIIKENCVNSLSYVDIEILNQQINKRGDKLNSEQFLDLLAKICCLLDDSFYKDKRGSFIKLIKVYILPFYLKKYNKENPNSKFYCDETFNLSMNLTFKNLILNDFVLDQDSFNILISIIEGIKVIYDIYFSLSELSADKNIKKIHDKSFSIFIKFLKNFDILPYLINQRLAELYWYLMISEDINDLYKISEEKNFFLKKFILNREYDIGNIYSFKKFLLLLPHISFYYYYPIKTKTNAQKLLYIIEKIYKSKGYQNMPNVYCKTFNKKYSIIPPVDIVEKVTKNIIENKKIIRSQNNEENLKQYIELNEENFSLLEKYIENLKNIFDIYCQIGDRSQFGKMTFSNYHKLLFDGELLLINDKIKKRNNKEEISKEDNEHIIINNNSGIKHNQNKKNGKKINNKDNIGNKISDDNILEKSKSVELSHANKETNENYESPFKLNNSDNNKRKLKLIDLNIIISIICGNPNVTNYQSKFSQIKEPNSSFKKNIILNTEFMHSNTDKGYRLDFILFLKSLVLISFRLYPNPNFDMNESMKLFLNNDIETFVSKLSKKCLLLYPRNEQFNDLFKLITSTEEILQLMDDIAPFINTYFDCYALNYEHDIKKMDFKIFIQFFKEYEIYPTWINLSILSEIFYNQIYRDKEEKKEKNIFKLDEKIDFVQFLECFVLIGLTMNSGNDLDMIDKILFLIDKMFSDNYGKIVKKIKSVSSLKDEYIFFEKILKEKYPSYYERKYSNAGHRYDNKFYWVYEKNYANDKYAQQIDFGELFNKEKVKFEDVFEEGNNEEKKEEPEYKNNETINEIKEE